MGEIGLVCLKNARRYAKSLRRNDGKVVWGFLKCIKKVGDRRTVSTDLDFPGNDHH